MKSKKRLQVVLFLLLTLSFQHIYATRYYVASDGAGAGTSWSDALNDLQATIDGAIAGDEIWVKSGTYLPDATDRTISFILKSGVKVYGGFQGVETNLDERILADSDGNGRMEHWEFQYPSILSGEIQDDGDESNNSHHVVLIPAAADATTLLSGFEIRGGYADVTYSSNDGPNACGAGILALAGKVEDCQIIDCKAIYDGNMSTAGAGIFALGAQINTSKIYNCIAENTSATGGNVIGGGVYMNSGSMLDSCVISSCYASCSSSDEAFGGGVYMNNSYIWDSHINNCYATGTNGDGGGIWMISSNLINSVVNNCEATRNGGAIYVQGSNVINCVIAKSKVTGTMSLGAGVYDLGSSSIHNSVLWGNYKGENLSNLRASVDGDVGNCASDQDLSGSNNILISSDNDGSEEGVLYPRFIGETSFTGVTNGLEPKETSLLNSDWNIEYTSDLIEKGNNSALNEAMQGDLNGDGDQTDRIEKFTDPLGENRLFNYNVDIGAFESVFIDLVLPSSPTVEYGSALGDIVLSGGSATDKRDASSIIGVFSFTDTEVVPPFTEESQIFQVTFTPDESVSSLYPLHYDSLTVTITAKVLTMSGLSAEGKVYDGTTTVTSFSGSAILEGVVNGDDVTLNTGAISAEFEDENAGIDKGVEFTGYQLSGANKDNYVLSLVGTTATITPKELSVTGVGADSKVYDGTSDASISGTPLLSGVIDGDDVSVDQSSTAGTFEDKNIGTGKTVTFNGFTLAGTDKDNYSLSQEVISSADITVLNVQVSGLSAEDKEYDALRDAVISGTAEVSGFISTDDIVLVETGASALFDTKHVGFDKQVVLTGYSLSGADASNYSLSQPNALTASILAKQLTVSGFFVETKEYDGTTQAIITGAPVLNDVLAGDDVNLNSASVGGVYADANAGVNKPVTVSGLSLSGADSGNYTLADLQLNGNIDPVSIAILADALSKVYNESDPELTYSITSGALVGGDTFDGALIRESGEDAGTYQIQQGALGLNSNYVISFTGNDFTIQQAANSIDFSWEAPVENAAIDFDQNLTITLNAIATSGEQIDYQSSDQNVAYVDDETGTLYILSYGNITITANESSNQNYESATPVTLNLSIVPKVTALRKGDNMLLIDNSDLLFGDVRDDELSGTYQWYNNGTAIAGATKQYYYNASGLSGEYYCMVTTNSRGDEFSSNTIAISIQQAINIYPSPAIVGQAFNVELDGFDQADLNNNSVQVYSITGEKLQQVFNLNQSNTMSISKPGVYIIKTTGGSKLAKRLIVK